MMSYPLHLIRTRNDLSARREPYWGPPVGQGRYLGFRKSKNGTGTWIARRRSEDNRSQKYKSLGQCTSAFDFNAARKRAEVWFRNQEAGISDEPPTVAVACREYVAELEVGVGDQPARPEAARDAEMRFRRTVYNHEIGKIRLDKIRTLKLKAWRNDLAGSDSSKNRNLTSLKAALNLAVENDRVHPDVSQRWRKVKAYKDAGGRQDLYIDVKQRRALLDACNGAVRDLVKAATLTGARPGDLSNAKVGQFDARTGMMTFRAKNNERTVPLSDQAIALFKRVSRGKLPTAYLFTRDDGKPWTHRKWSYPIREAAIKAKLPKGVKLYSLRHSWITDAILGGMSTLEVSRLSGTSLQMIEEHYGHLVHEAARERLNKVSML